MFDVTTYINRRHELSSGIESGIILLMGNDASPMNYADNVYRFRQDSTFLYYFALSREGLVGIIDVDQNEHHLFGNDFTIDELLFMGFQPTLPELAEAAGVKETGTLSQLENYLKEAVEKGRSIHFLPPYRAENKIKLWHWLGIDPKETQRSASVELIKSIVAQREIKSDEELEEIEKAVDTSVDMHISAMQMVRPGIIESDIVSKVHEIALQAGGYVSFPVIATIHGETLHNSYHGNKLKEGDLFLLDCGAETTMGYAGDLSSTIPVSKQFSARQKEIYDIVLESHDRSIELLKPGISFKDIYYAASGVIVDGLKGLGIINGDTEEIVQAGAHAMFFQCGLGHQMGLDVHDMEDLGEVYVGYEGKAKSTQFGIRLLRLAKPLTPGMVLTIEPGIYFIPSLIDMWRAENRFTDFINYDKLEAYKDFGGIRNEENFVITKDGYNLLGKKKPKTIEEVEKLRVLI